MKQGHSAEVCPISSAPSASKEKISIARLGLQRDQAIPFSGLLSGREVHFGYDSVGR